jgi:hypothetical protein
MSAVEPLAAFVDGIGVLGPGLTDWAAAARVLRGETSWHHAPTVLPTPQCLPAAERRRTGAPVRLALAVGLEATSRAGADPATLPAVFAASGGDGVNCHEICQVLASNERQLSPTRFHNSVHNAASGYWGIATGATAASNALCAYDASFGAGLLEALVQLTIERTAVLLIGYDTGYPEPLHRARPIPDAFGVAMLLAPARGATSIARLAVTASDQRADRLTDTGLERLRHSIPAARSLPLLGLLAREEAGRVSIGYLEEAALLVEVSACR